MSKRILTEEQIAKLLENENISKCSEKSITYSKDFKIKVIKEYNEKGMPASEVFRQTGLDLRIIGRDSPKECLKRWKKLYRTRGVKSLSEENRGKVGRRLKKTKDKSDKDKIKRLELEIEYLKAENDFLAKLRAKRRKT